jgi:predicted dehydrogenase
MKVLMIGMGGIGQRHARNLHAVLGKNLELLAYRVRGLSDVVTERLQMDSSRNIEHEYNLRVFTDLDRALAEAPDLAFVCNPSSLHVPVALACVNAGCDVFIEKPLSNSLEGVEALLEAVQSHKRVAMVGFQLRFHPCLQKLSSTLKKAQVGRPLAVRAIIGEYLPAWHPYEDYRRMYAARADLGGGVVLSQIHELDYLYSLFGLPRRLFAVGGHLSHLEIDVEDTASILMECCVEGRSLPVHLQQDYVQRPPCRQCEVIGDEGKVLADFHAPTVVVYDGQGNVAAKHNFPGFERNQLFLDEIRHLLNCVKNRENPLVDLRAGMNSLQLALSVKESMSTGRLVTLDSADRGMQMSVNEEAKG